MKAQILAGFACALALAGCNNDTPSEEAADVTTQDVAPPTAEAAMPEASPQRFVNMTASSDMYELEAAKLAGQMGKSEKIKSFAQMMITDHTASTEKLKAAVAQESGLAVPSTLEPKHQANLDALRNAGENFDTLYAEQQVAAHEEALALLKDQAQRGTLAALKTFASETAPVVEGHLGHARDLP